VNNPFLKKRIVDVSKLHVTFLSDTPAESLLYNLKVIKSKSDEFLISREEIYIFFALMTMVKLSYQTIFLRKS